MVFNKSRLLNATPTVPINVIIAWPSTNGSIPSGWSRETSLDAQHVKQVVTAGTNPGTTGGATNHLHAFGAHTHTGPSHSHAAGTSGTPNSGAALGSQAFNTRDSNGHTHAYTVTAATADTSGAFAGISNWDATTTEPPFFTVIFIKSNGTPLGFPNSSLVYFNGAAPSGWATHASSANRFWKGAAAAGDGGGTGGTGDVHSHTSQNHTHASGAGHTHPLSLSGSGASALQENGTGFSCSSVGHTHTGTSGSIAAPYNGTAAPTSSNGSMVPAWKKMNPIQNTSGTASFAKNAIAMWLGTIATIPQRWKICDGNNGTPNLLDLYVNGAANSGEVGNTGGAATHTHATAGSHTHTTDVHIHGTSTSTSGGGGANTGGAGSTIAAHGHSMPALANDGSGVSAAATVDAAANASNDPAHTRVAYIQYTG